MKQKRSPIVTVLGHVDHGKTTLLDAIRKTSVASREAGGITQSIGASQIVTPEGEITFVDTPGHAAFAAMRSRGAKVADIVLLVVAADDGPMPQTKEALGYIKENKIPYIVVLTKVDLPSANIERARGQLESEEVFFEGRGGNVSSVEVSAKAGKGINELVDLIHLMAAVNDISADADANLEAYVIETNKDKRGTIVSVVVKNGTLKVGDEISIEGIKTNVKGLFDENDKPVKAALPGTPVAILGFTHNPQAGSKVIKGKNDEPSKEDYRSQKIKKVGKDQIGLVVKAETAGSLEAINASLPGDAVVLSSSIGDVTESDVFFAKSTGATIIVFEARVPTQVRKLAETEDVEISTFGVIYEMLKFVEDKIKGGRVVVLGKAEVLAIFPYERTKVAGCKMVEGRIQKSDSLILKRGEKELGKAKIVSMRRAKNEISEAKVGEDCGIILSPLLSFEKGDILVAIKL